MAENQHGFQKGRSTIGSIREIVDIITKAWSGSLSSRQVCILLTLDVKNVFNSARWDDILYALKHRFGVSEEILALVDSYLSDRVLMVNTTKGTLEYKLSAGVPQGSVVGPDLWNVDYDGPFRISMPEQVHLTGFADDISATVMANRVDEAYLLVQYTIEIVSTWLEKHQLCLAKHKTEMVVSTRQKWFPEPFSMSLDGNALKSAKSVRYLGVKMDAKLSFQQHIECACAKASRTVSNLSRIMEYTTEPRSKKRRPLLEVVHSILLYGAEV